MAGTVNKPKKPKSKRVPTRLKKKIEKASAAKQRKQRKLAKKNPEWRSKLKKDPGIPNLFPYKDKILEEIEVTRARKAEEKERRREMARAARTGVVGGADKVEVEEGDLEDDLEDMEDDMEDTMDLDDGGDVDESNPLAALLASAKAAAQNYEKELQSGSDMDDDDDSDDGSDVEVEVSQASSRKAYDKVYKQVIEQADVVLYVLDARDPEGTRSRDIERSIMAAATNGKRLILVVNKIDLVPPQVLKGWIAHLRRSFPTLPLRASNPAPNAQTFNHKELTVQNTSAALFRALKAFAASRNLKRAVSVGVIGYPNVGKSSVINALLSRLGGKANNSSKACPAGAEAGVTTSIRAVKIDNKLTLLDSPGIIFPSSSLLGGPIPLKTAVEKNAHLILLNVVPPKQIDDPTPAVTLLLRRLSATPDLFQKLLDVYDIPPLVGGADASDLTTSFLVEVARRRGRLGRGGIPNLNAAAMTVITDWRDGRIQGWLDPPVLPVVTNPAEAKKAAAAGGADELGPDEKVIVTEWAKEFKLDGLWGDDEPEAMQQ